MSFNDFIEEYKPLGIMLFIIFMIIGMLTYAIMVADEAMEVSEVEPKYYKQALYTYRTHEVMRPFLEEAMADGMLTLSEHNEVVAIYEENGLNILDDHKQQLLDIIEQHQ